MERHRVGLVVESAEAERSGNVLARVSLYADARTIRPWSDRTIL